jgi:hypothetical protein
MPIPEFPGIETLNWVPTGTGPGNGFVKSAGPRLVSEVAADLTRALEEHGPGGLEYISTRGYTDDPAARWPEGETFVALTVGGSEGYSLAVHVTPPRPKHFNDPPRPTVQPIRAKLLCTRDDALAYHALAFHLLGS